MTLKFNVVPLFMLLLVVVCALAPGFAILACYQHVLYSPTASSSILYIFKAILSTILMCVAMMVYSDIAFPVIMSSFEKIFQRIDLQ